MRLTRLVLDLPGSGIRIVIVDDEEVVNICLAMVLARFGALITSGPATTVSGLIGATVPSAYLSEIGADEALAVVQKVGEPGEGEVEISLTNSPAAVALALSITDLDPLLN